MTRETVRRSLVVVLVVAGCLLASTAAAEGGSVRFSYEKVEIGGELQWALVPEPAEALRGKVTSSSIEKAFRQLKRDKGATYGKSTISASGRPPRATVEVRIDPKVKRYALIIMAETVYTLSELGVKRVDFPGHASNVSRADIPFAAYALTVPLWKAVPNMDSDFVQVRMPDGSLEPSTEVHDRWREKDAALLADVYGYLESDDVYTVTSVARLLPSLKIEYTDRLLPLLKSKHRVVRKTALGVLERERDQKKVLDAVVELMDQEKDDTLAFAAAEFLGKSKKDSYSVQKLYFELDRGTDKQAIAAAKRLAENRDERTPQRLYEQLDSKAKPVAMAAADALAGLNATKKQLEVLDEDDIDAFIKMVVARDLAKDRDETARLAGNDYVAEHAGTDEALAAIAEIGDIDTDAARKTLEGYLTADDSHLRVAAAAQLAERGAVASLDPLAGAIGKGSDVEALEDAGYRIMLQQSLDTVLEKTKGGDNNVQRMAYRALGERARKEGAGARAFDILKKGLNNRDPLIRGAAARAIGTYSNEAAAEALESVANDDSATVRRDVALAIGHLEEGVMAEQLNTYLDDDAPDVVAASIESLEKREEAFAWDKVKAHTQAKAPQVRAAALQALTTLVSREDQEGVRDVISMLSGAVTDDAYVVRETAVSQLGRFEDEKAVTAIALQLGAEEEPMRLTAVRALADTGHSSAAAVVANALADPSQKVRRAAILALGELEGSSAKTALQKRVDKEDDPELVNLIKQTLEKI